MSGRDMRTFVTSHRMGEMDKLVRRVQDGLQSQKYKQVDYDKLKAFATEKKQAGEEKLLKVKKLKDASKQGKDNHLLKQHRGVWKRELNRLKHSQKKAEVELDFFLHQHTIDDGDCATLFKDFEDYELRLETGREKFQKATVGPVEELREDLQYWLRQYKDDAKGPEVVAEHQMVLETIESVKDQQYQLLNKLHHEQVSVQRQIIEGDTTQLTQNSDQNFQHGIPAEAFDLDCPDADFKATVLQEFILLDAKYVERLEHLEDEHYDAISNETGGWLEEEHRLFTVILEQYPYDVSNRRVLYIDRLRREFPHKTRHEIVSHEEWWMLWRYYHERKRDLVHDWKRDRHELLNKVKLVFAESCSQHQLSIAKSEHVAKQQELCKILCEKLEKWREKKMIALQLQISLEEKQLHAAMEKRKEEEEKERKRRETEKVKINHYKKEQEEYKRQQEEEQRKQLEELRTQLAEQARVDQERVKFREEKYLEKLEDKRQKEVERHEERIEQERRLEALREQVRPQVECDLLRVWKDTESWNSRLKGEEEVDIQKPLYKVNTFTSKQVTSDPRYKLEQKLRAAGLHKNAYARQLITNMQGTQPARKDQQSTIFKQ